jgi:hypothetical protein
LGKREQIKPPRSDVLTHIARPDRKTPSIEFVMQLLVEQMHLPEVGLGRIAGEPRAVLDRSSHMGISLNSHAREEVDAVLSAFREGVALSAAHGSDDGRP